MFQNFDSEITEVSVRIFGIDEVPQEMKELADSYIVTAALLIHGAVNKKISFQRLLDEQKAVCEEMSRR